MPLTERTIETSFDWRHRRSTILAALVPIQFLEQLVNGRADVLCGVATTFRYRADEVSDHLENALGIELNNFAVTTIAEARSIGRHDFEDLRVSHAPGGNGGDPFRLVADILEPPPPSRRAP